MKRSFSTGCISLFLLVSITFILEQDASAFGKRRRVAPSTPPPVASTPTPTPAATPAPSNTPTPTPPPSGSTLPTGAPTCVSQDPNQICIGLKVASFTENGNPVLTQAQAIALTDGINKVWSQCHVAFQMEEYQAVDPASLGLSFDVNWSRDGDKVRSAFNDYTSFLVVAVGSLTGSTIAVTEMPDAGVYGTLVDQDYATNPLTVGHELGHYQGLYHVSNSSNLMNPYIGSNTSGLTASQCSTARSTDFSNWQIMMRH